MPPAPLGSTERTNQLLSEASKMTGIKAPTFGTPSSLSVTGYRDNPSGTTTNFLSNGESETGSYKPNVDGTLTFIPQSTTGLNASMPEGVDFKLTPKETVPSSSLVGGRTVADILKRRSELEQEIIKAAKPSQLETDLTDQLNSVKQLSRKAQLDLNRETERVQSIGGLSQDISSQWTSDFARRMQRTIGDLGVGASGLADALQAEIDKRTVNVDSAKSLLNFDKENLSILKDLQTMTKPDVIGSPQVNEITGEVTVFKQDPQTGEIVSESIGNVGPSKQYIQSGTYQDASGNQVFWGLNADKTIETQVMSGGVDSGNQNMVTLPGVGTVNGNAAALAQQYASTGALPSPAELKAAGASFEEVTSIAQGLPKAPGTIVDKNTGVKSKVINETQEAGIIALKDAIEKIDALKVMYAEGSRGLFSTDKTRYETLKGEIVDALARARSGAALTEDEVKMYNEKIPGYRTSIPAFGRTKLDGLKSSLEGKLKTTLDANGAAIYGYSKVKVMGNEYTVGDVIDNGAGQTGRVNPNGTITVEEDPLSFNSVGGDTNIASIKNAIAQIESGGRYDAVSPVNRNGERAYGKYQVMENNIPAWTKEALGRSLTIQEFISNPQAQEKTAEYQMAKIYKQYGNPDDVAAVWFSGRPLKGNKSSDVTGTSVPQYVARFRKALGQA